jgi:hypothetical protein
VLYRRGAHDNGAIHNGAVHWRRFRPGVFLRRAVRLRQFITWYGRPHKFIATDSLRAIFSSSEAISRAGGTLAYYMPELCDKKDRFYTTMNRLIVGRGHRETTL